MGAASYLAQKDPILETIIKHVTLEPLTLDKDYFSSLVEEIISQQLSMKAADTIFNRFLGLFPGQAALKTEQVITLPLETLRNIGLSTQKAHYIQNLAHAITAKEIDFVNFGFLSDEEVIAQLTKIKGIGRWTAEMFLLFSLGRQNVFSYGDLGLRNAMRRLYNLRKDPSPRRASQISNPWQPYRSIACRYLWASLKM